MKVIKQFGLNEALVLASQPGAHVPTVKATLKVLGIVNVVGVQVKKIVDSSKASLEACNKAVVDLGIQDGKDAKETEEAIIRMQAARADRMAANRAAVASKTGESKNLEATIKDLEALAERFA